MTITRTAYDATIISLTLLLTSCGVSKERLDEVVFYDGPRFKLKLVRYYENYPLHFTGEVFRVQCASAHTTNPGNEMQDPGWVVLGNGAAIGSKNAAEVASREQKNASVESRVGRINSQSLILIIISSGSPARVTTGDGHYLTYFASQSLRHTPRIKQCA